ncbi:hypothetical protein SGCOL_006441 [Colletotrichum sp. CLE4]
MEHDEPGLMGSVEMLQDLMSTYDMDPLKLIQIVMQCPPKLTKATVHVVVMLLHQQKLLENVLELTELRAMAAAQITKATKNNQKMKKDKKTKKRTGKASNVKNDNENAKSGDSLAVKGPEDKSEKNQTKKMDEKATNSSEINAMPSIDQSTVFESKNDRPRKKKKKKKKKKARKSIETAGNKLRVPTDQPPVPPTTKTTEKEKNGKGSKADEISAGPNTKQSAIPESKKGKAKEKTGKDPETAKKNTGATTEQQEVPKTPTSPTKTQNNNKVECCSKRDKGKKNASVSKPTGGGFFSALEVGFMQRSLYRVLSGIMDCQEVWYVVQMMQEAMVELQQAKAKQQKESSAN